LYPSEWKKELRRGGTVRGRFQGSVVGEREVVSGVEFNRKGLLEEKLDEE